MLEIVNYNKEDYNFPALVVLGCFDAVHVGHAELLKKAKLQAKINGLDLGVMMFAEGKGGRQVFTFEERLAFLAGYNTKFVLKIDYTDEFKKTTAADFLHNLEEHINVKAYMSGKDFRFGAGAKGKSSTLKNYAEDEENGVWYMPVKDVTVDGEKVSTTLIKKCIEEGKIQKANTLLGRQYFVTGEVCEGHGRGKTLGFPTANVVYPANKVLVKDGVYGVEAEIDGTVYRGVANCGPRPTFGEDAVVLEAYFEGLSEELYGKSVTIKFVNYIRGIKKFESAEALSEQISRDLTCIGAPDVDPDAEEAAPAEEIVAEEKPAEPEAPAEAPAEVATQTPAEVAVETPAATEAPAEEPVEMVEEVSAAEPAEEPVPVQEEVPAEVPVEEAEEPAAEPEVAPAEEVKAEQVQSEPEQPAEEPAPCEVIESDVADPEGEIAVAAEPTEEEAVSKLVEEVFEGKPETPAEEQPQAEPETSVVADEQTEVSGETVAEEPSAEPEESEPAIEAEPVTEAEQETHAEEPQEVTITEEVAVSEDTEEAPSEVAAEESAETVAEEQSEVPAEVAQPTEQPVEEAAEIPAEEAIEQPADEEPAEEPAQEPAADDETEAEETQTSEEEQEQEASEQTSRKSKKRKRSRGKADRRRGDTRKR